MIFTQDMKDLIELFNINNVEYALVGGFAVNYYGYVRTTQDIDILINPSKNNAVKTVNALISFGFGKDGVAKEYFEKEGTALHLGIAPNRIDLLTNLKGISNSAVFKNIEKTSYENCTIKIISLTDLIKCKELSNRKKDQADAEELSNINLKNS